MRRLLLLVALALASGCSPGPGPTDPDPVASSPTATAERPNVVLLYADDMGWGDPEQATMPTLDALAEQGVRLESFYVAAPLCSPSRASLMTGLYPPDTGVLWNQHVTDPLDPEENEGSLDPAQLTLAEALRGAGYRTALFGKWGLMTRDDVSTWPWNYGFDRSWGPIGGPNTGVFYADAHETEDRATIAESSMAYARHGLDWIAEDPTRPFFLYIAPHDPHTPHEGTREDALRRLDASLSLLLNGLQSLGLSDRTLVFVTSDNGAPAERSNAPLSGRKGECSEGGIRMRAVARWPGHTSPGTGVVTVASTLDLLPTFAAAAGVDLPGIYPGTDIKALLEGREMGEREHICWYRGEAATIRRGSWKYQRPTDKNGERTLLFNLELDPGERFDQSAGRPDLVEQLEARLHQLD